MQCPECKSINVRENGFFRVGSFVAEIVCDDCEHVFEAAYPDYPPDDDESLDFDDHYNTGGNPDEWEVSGGRK